MLIILKVMYIVYLSSDEVSYEYTSTEAFTSFATTTVGPGSRIV